MEGNMFHPEEVQPSVLIHHTASKTISVCISFPLAVSSSFAVSLFAGFFSLLLFLIKCKQLTDRSNQNSENVHLFSIQNPN